MKQLTLMICCHNHGRYIKQLLECIFDQTLDPALWEILILFDGCTDQSELIFNNEWENLCAIRGKKQDWLKVTKVIRPEKKGLASCKNDGLRRVTTPYVAYIDVDDSAFPQRLEIQLNFLKNHPKTDFVFTQAFDRDQYGRLLINCFSIGEYVIHEQIAARLYSENVLMHGSFMGRMQSLRDVGFYDESLKFKGIEDWMLWIRALNKGKKFYKINERLSIYSLNTSTER